MRTVPSPRRDSQIVERNAYGFERVDRASKRFDGLRGLTTHEEQPDTLSAREALLPQRSRARRRCSLRSARITASPSDSASSRAICSTVAGRPSIRIDSCQASPILRASNATGRIRPLPIETRSLSSWSIDSRSTVTVASARAAGTTLKLALTTTPKRAHGAEMHAHQVEPAHVLDDHATGIAQCRIRIRYLDSDKRIPK